MALQVMDRAVKFISLQDEIINKHRDTRGIALIWMIIKFNQYGKANTDTDNRLTEDLLAEWKGEQDGIDDVTSMLQ